MEEEGTSTADAVSKIWMVDSKGLLTKVYFYKLWNDVFFLTPIDLFHLPWITELSVLISKTFTSKRLPSLDYP